eukprot:gene20870-32186_t
MSARRLYAAAPSAGTRALKEVRAMTGAGLLDCKKALAESGDDIDAALKWLEHRGIAKADKKRGRAAAAGAVAVAQVEGDAGGIVVFELNSESDFVARTEQFLKLMSVVQHAAAGTAAALAAADRPRLLEVLQGDEQLAAAITDGIAKTGENIKLRRAVWIPCPEHGAAGCYIHNKVPANDHVAGAGLVASICCVAPELPAPVGNPAALAQAATQLAQHILAESVSESSGTPLREQQFMGTEKTVGGWLKAKAKAAGCKRIEVSNTLLWRCGEGVEVQQSNFAEEVAKMTQA